jgi:hypothetical protein
VTRPVIDVFRRLSGRRVAAALTFIFPRALKGENASVDDAFSGGRYDVSLRAERIFAPASSEGSFSSAANPAKFDRFRLFR